MKSRLLLPALLLVSLAAARAAEDDGWASLPSAPADSASPVSGEALLQDCRSRLPSQTVGMKGWIRDRRPRGVVEREGKFEAVLRWTDENPGVSYEFSDNAGNPVLRAEFVPAPEGTESVFEKPGEDGKPTRIPDSEAPAMNGSVLGTDISWNLLSLDFLRWTNAVLTGEANVKGRLCDLVEVFPPGKLEGCAKVRLWVDREIRMFLMAQELNDEGKIVRQMWVRSVKKMDGQWMVQDLEVESSLRRGHRTRVHVESCDFMDAPPSP